MTTTTAAARHGSGGASPGELLRMGQALRDLQAVASDLDAERLATLYRKGPSPQKAGLAPASLLEAAQQMGEQSGRILTMLLLNPDLAPTASTARAADDEGDGPDKGPGRARGGGDEHPPSNEEVSDRWRPEHPAPHTDPASETSSGPVIPPALSAAQAATAALTHAFARGLGVELHGHLVHPVDTEPTTGELAEQQARWLQALAGLMGGAASAAGARDTSLAPAPLDLGPGLAGGARVIVQSLALAAHVLRQVQQDQPMTRCTPPPEWPDAETPEAGSQAAAPGRSPPPWHDAPLARERAHDTALMWDQTPDPALGALERAIRSLTQTPPSGGSDHLSAPPPGAVAPPKSDRSARARAKIDSPGAADPHGVARLVRSGGVSVLRTNARELGIGFETPTDFERGSRAPSGERGPQDGPAKGARDDAADSARRRRAQARLYLQFYRRLRFAAEVCESLRSQGAAADWFFFSEHDRRGGLPPRRIEAVYLEDLHPSGRWTTGADATELKVQLGRHQASTAYVSVRRMNEKGQPILVENFFVMPSGVPTPESHWKQRRDADPMASADAWERATHEMVHKATIPVTLSIHPDDSRIFEHCSEQGAGEPQD